MPDLRDGESVEIQGSARSPYVLKNVGGVYSCSCPAWRNQSLPIERRSCKHLRTLRTSAAEDARIGSVVTLAETTTVPASRNVPPLLLAHSWENDIEPSGWFLSELCGTRHNSLYVVATVMWHPAVDSRSSWIKALAVRHIMVAIKGRRGTSSSRRRRAMALGSSQSLSPRRLPVLPPSSASPLRHTRWSSPVTRGPARHGSC